MSAGHRVLATARRLSVSAYDRESVLAHVAAVLPAYEWDSDGARRVRRATDLTVGVLDHLDGDRLQDRWDCFETSVWPDWVAGRNRLPLGACWTWGPWMLVISRLARPSLTMPNVRLNQWVARLPAIDPLVAAAGVFAKTAETLEWGTPAFKALALRSGLRLLLWRGYDDWDQLTADDMASLPLGTDGSDLLDAVLSRMGVVDRGPLRGTIRRTRRPRRSPAELVDAAEIPLWCKPVTTLYLDTYSARLSDRYATLRHKLASLGHFWRYLAAVHPEITACRDITPAATRGFVAYVVDPKRSAVPVFRRMLGSHTKALERAREIGEPAGQIAARELEIERIRSALRRAEELSEDVATAIESAAG